MIRNFLVFKQFLQIVDFCRRFVAQFFFAHFQLLHLIL